MKRRPLIIAAVVTVAALACVVPVWEDVWMWVAYEERTMVHFEGWVINKKRVEWLPGPAWVLRDQLCSSCLDSEHRHCKIGLLILRRRTVELEGGEIWEMGDGDDAACICPTCPGEVRESYQRRHSQSDAGR